jgi:hypothetical protein
MPGRPFFASPLGLQGVFLPSLPPGKVLAQTPLGLVNAKAGSSPALARMTETCGVARREALEPNHGLAPQATTFGAPFCRSQLSL